MKPISTRKLISKAKFMRWLAAQPDSRTFDFTDTSRCMFASFLNETHPGEVFSCGSFTFSHRSADWTTHRFPKWVADMAPVLGSFGRGHAFSVCFVRQLLKFKTA